MTTVPDCPVCLLPTGTGLCLCGKGLRTEYALVAVERWAVRRWVHGSSSAAVRSGGGQRGGQAAGDRECDPSCAVVAVARGWCLFRRFLDPIMGVCDVEPWRLRLITVPHGRRDVGMLLERLQCQEVKYSSAAGGSGSGLRKAKRSCGRRTGQERWTRIDR